MKVKISIIGYRIADGDEHYVLIEWRKLRILDYCAPESAEFWDDYLSRYRLTRTLLISERIPYKYRTLCSVERELDEEEEEELLSQAMAKAVDRSAYLAEISCDPWRAR